MAAKKPVQQVRRSKPAADVAALDRVARKTGAAPEGPPPAGRGIVKQGDRYARRTTLYLDVEIGKMLATAAVEDGCSMSDVANAALIDWFAARKQTA